MDAGGGPAQGMADRPGADGADQALEPNDDPLAFLIAVMNNAQAAPNLRVRAAIAAVQYKHSKRGEGGKREDAADKAKKAAGGRFGVRQGPPSLKVVGGR